MAHKICLDQSLRSRQVLDRGTISPSLLHFSCIWQNMPLLAICLKISSVLSLNIVLEQKQSKLRTEIPWENSPPPQALYTRLTIHYSSELKWKNIGGRGGVACLFLKEKLKHFLSFFFNDVECRAILTSGKSLCLLRMWEQLPRQSPRLHKSWKIPGGRGITFPPQSPLAESLRAAETSVLPGQTPLIHSGL